MSIQRVPLINALPKLCQGGVEPSDVTAWVIPLPTCVLGSAVAAMGAGGVPPPLLALCVGCELAGGGGALPVGQCA